MITVDNITFSYPGTKRNVFEDFSLKFEENRIYGLLGKNGMGKSTMLYLISGLLQPSGGTVKVDGMEARLRQAEMLQEIFLVPEEFELPRTTLDEYVRMNEPFYPRFSREVLQNCLNEFELPLTLRLNALSMGQKKKVYMSFALAAGDTPAAHGRAYERTRHTVEEPVPQGCGKQHDRGPHTDNIHPSGARRGVAA